jgi:hypothetical protein
LEATLEPLLAAVDQVPAQVVEWVEPLAPRAKGKAGE